MIEFKHSISIKRPINEVFAFLSDFENISKWNYYVLEVRRVSEGAVGVGTTYHQLRKTDEQLFQITEFESNLKVAVKTLPESPLKFERRFTLQAEGSTTHLIDEWEELDTGKSALIEKLAAGRIKSDVAENLGKLKELLETGSVTL
jgi:uncharacterized membrane protein